MVSSVFFLLVLAFFGFVGTGGSKGFLVKPCLPQSVLSQASAEIARAQGEKPKGKEAYVTLLYGNFMLGTRVLGQTLRETNTSKDMVVLCMRTVSAEAVSVLQADGWIVRYIDNIPNPYAGHSSRGDYFSGAYSKIHIWNMTEYDRVVYLDSDVVVVSNADHMFNCGTFCAVFRYADLFNSGSMVIEPSTTIYKDMLKKIPLLSSFDVADQGFFNKYFENLVYAPLFNRSDPSRNYQPMRMPNELNFDMGPYYSASQGNTPISEVVILHYSLGPIKPWLWWADFLFDLNWYWTAARKRLPRYPYHDDSYRLAYHPIFWFPYPALILLYFGLRKLPYNHKCLHKALNLYGYFYKKSSQFIPLVSLVLSYFITFKFIVPSTMLPSQAEYAFWLWSNTLLVIMVGVCCYFAGKRTMHDCHTISRKKLKTFAMYCGFTLSYVSVKILPPLVSPFPQRVVVCFLLLCFHFVTAHIVGLIVLRLWEGRQKSSSKKPFDSSQLV